MYKITLSVTNPNSGDSISMPYLVDENAFDANEWADGYPIAQDLINQVKALSAGKEPALWSSAATALTATAKPTTP